MLCVGLIAAAGSVTAQDAMRKAAPETSLGSADEAIAFQTRQRALEKTPSRAVVAWRGATAGVRGSVTPLRTYLARNGMFCREFEEVTVLPRATITENHLACRDANGTWQLAR